MGDLIKLYERRKPRIEVLLKGESQGKIKSLKDLAYNFFAKGDISLMDKITWEYGLRFDGCSLTLENGEILLIYNEIPYLIWTVNDVA